MASSERKSIERLLKKHLATPIYVVGTGPSLRLFPLNFFQDKITIGLNQAFKYFSPTYSLTVHPYLIPYVHTTWNTIWITKIKHTCPSFKEHRKLGNYSRFYLFDNNNRVNDFSFITKRKKTQLYVGRGIQTGGIHLAHLMGASHIILVGCDMCSLGNEYHGHDQHIEFHGYTPEEVYKEYYYYTVKVRELIKTPVLTLSPFLGEKFAEEDFNYLKKERNLADLPKPKEIEVNVRSQCFISDFFQ